MPHILLPDGVNLYYEFHRGGQIVNDLSPHKPNVVLIHPLCTNLSAWKAQVQDPRLADNYNLILFDAKFHGKSVGPVKEGYEYATYSEELEVALDKLGISGCHWVGETFAGCRPIIHLATRRKDLVKSAMLISPGFFDGEPEEVKEIFREVRDLFLQANRAIQAGEIDRSTPNRVVSFDALQSYINYTFGECLSEERVEEEKTRLDWQRGRCPPEWTNEVFGAHLNMGVIPNLDRITQPVLLVRGSLNATESPQNSCDKWKAALSNSSHLEFHLIHGAPSRALTTYPFIVSRFMAGWLRKVTQMK